MVFPFAEQQNPNPLITGVHTTYKLRASTMLLLWSLFMRRWLLVLALVPGCELWSASGFLAAKSLRLSSMSRATSFPVFDPLDDELSFPIPFDRRVTTYRFTRPMHLELMKAVLETEEKCFFHAVQKPSKDGLGGAIGCLARVVSVVEESAVEEEDDSSPHPLRVATVCAARGRVEAIESTRPFATARVAQVRDERLDDGLRGEAFDALRSVVELSSKIEQRGLFADQAEDTLREIRVELDQRFESPETASFFLVAKTQLPHSAATDAVATLDSSKRFQIALDFLEPLRAELAAKAAIDSLSSSSSSSSSSDSPPLLLSKGQRVSFFWSTQDGWFDATIVGVREPRTGWYKVRWDVDGTETHVEMDLQNRARWRLLR